MSQSAAVATSGWNLDRTARHDAAMPLSVSLANAMLRWSHPLRQSSEALSCSPGRRYMVPSASSHVGLPRDSYTSDRVSLAGLKSSRSSSWARKRGEWRWDLLGAHVEGERWRPGSVVGTCRNAHLRKLPRVHVVVDDLVAESLLGLLSLKNPLLERAGREEAVDVALLRLAAAPDARERLLVGAASAGLALVSYD